MKIAPPYDAFTSPVTLLSLKVPFVIVNLEPSVDLIAPPNVPDSFFSNLDSVKFAIVSLYTAPPFAVALLLLKVAFAILISAGLLPVRPFMFAIAPPLVAEFSENVALFTFVKSTTPLSFAKNDELRIAPPTPPFSALLPVNSTVAPSLNETVPSMLLIAPPSCHPAAPFAALFSNFILAASNTRLPVSFHIAPPLSETLFVKFITLPFNVNVSSAVFAILAIAPPTDFVEPAGVPLLLFV